MRRLSLAIAVGWLIFVLLGCATQEKIAQLENNTSMKSSEELYTKSRSPEANISVLETPSSEETFQTELPSISCTGEEHEINNAYPIWLSYPDRRLYMPYYNDVLEDEFLDFSDALIEWDTDGSIVIEGQKYISFTTYRDECGIIPGLLFHRIDLRCLTKKYNTDKYESIYSNTDGSLVLLQNKDGSMTRFIRESDKDSVLYSLNTNMFDTVTVNGVISGKAKDFGFVLETISNQNQSGFISINEFSQYPHDEFEQILFLWKYDQIEGLYLGVDVVFFQNRYYVLSPSELSFCYIGEEWQTTMDFIRQECRIAVNNN